MVVGQRDEIDAGQSQRLGRFGRRLEGVALIGRCAHVAQGTFQIGDGVVGSVEDVLDAGEGVDEVASGQDDLPLRAVDVDVADGRQANGRQGCQGGGQRRGQRLGRRLAARRGDQCPRLMKRVLTVRRMQPVHAQRLAVRRHGAPRDSAHQVVAAGQDGLGLGVVEQLPVGREGYGEGQRLAADDEVGGRVAVGHAAHSQPRAPLGQGGGRVVGGQQGQRITGFCVGQSGGDAGFPRRRQGQRQRLGRGRRFGGGGWIRRGRGFVGSGRRSGGGRFR